MTAKTSHKRVPSKQVTIDTDIPSSTRQLHHTQHHHHHQHHDGFYDYRNDLDTNLDNIQAKDLLTVGQNISHGCQPSTNVAHAYSNSASSSSAFATPQSPISPTSQTSARLYKHQTIQATIYIVGWYIFSLSISIYNKWMFGSQGLDFKYPILITSFHQLCLFFLSGLILYMRPDLRPKVPTQGSRRNSVSSVFELTSQQQQQQHQQEQPSSPQVHQQHQQGRSRSPSSISLGGTRFNYQGFNFPKFITYGIAMPLGMYLRNIIPCALASAGDIGLSNVSISLISLSLYTMLKTSSLMFVLIFGLLFKLERFNWRLICICVVMVFSVVMMTDKNDSGSEDNTDEGSARQEDSGFGITLVILASMLSGLRWSFTQILLKSNSYTSNSISTIFYIAPFMGLVLFILGLFIEKWSNFISSPIWVTYGIAQTTVLLVIPGLLAFMMTLCEFKLLGVAQIITLSIAGIFKELLTILISSIVFGDQLSLINWVGLCITFADVLWYNYYRYLEKDTELAGVNEHGHPYVSVGNRDLEQKSAHETKAKERNNSIFNDNNNDNDDDEGDRNETGFYAGDNSIDYDSVRLNNLNFDLDLENNNEDALGLGNRKSSR
ncbi:hypothetical protein PVL30_005234 [Lodderomyces elongisporus]|uniref:uncharacterized protein n=1 Tax=Lodderomyces elongisporus TaxID=36914 RepID=UPI002926CF56|nr:uncharacterized protein PVL30_005234 [Lodderomyces elongisporus]WLF81437.1 hypothetical protein PVL30_005234 [Lodderomyces elongisporus]